MKKTKLIGLAALMLSLGVVGCGETPEEESEQVEEKCSHDWTDWKSDAEHHWKECTKCGEKKSEAEHKYNKVADDQTGVVRATCTAAGQVVKACTCGATTVVTEEALGHDMQELGAEAEGYVAATCQAAGVMPTKCSRCEETDSVEIPIADHNYVAVTEDDAAIVAASGKVAKKATCEEAGVELTICHGCNDVKENAVAALGHKMVTNDTSEPAEGKATVRVYTCENGCGKTELGFKANEVSAASKEHLVIDETTGGARFWGRPIGNDVALDKATGDPSEDSHEAVFNAAQSGDYFEYVFDLTEEQASKLQNCRLYCEAEAASWMQQNGMDFWACKSGDTDWTRGMYVETTDTHTVGYDIDTYRYILYVDDEVKDFDPTISVPAGSSSVKQEYVLPYTFKLHSGTNKIRLVMAGGYRSTFYNFIFKAVEEEQGGGEEGGDPVAEPIKLNVTDATGYNKPSEKCKSTGTWTVDSTSVPAGEYSVKITAKCTSPDHVDRKWYNMAKADLCVDGVVEETKTSSPDTADQADYRYFLKVNDKVYNPDGKDSWGTIGLTSKDFNTVDFISKIVVTDKTTSISINHGNIGFSLYIQDIQLTRTGDHVHNFVENACDCGATRVALAALTDGTFADGSSNKSETPEGFLKIASNGQSISYSFTAAAAGKVTIAVDAAMDSWLGNKNNSMYSRKSGTGCNIEIKVGDNALDLSKFENVKYGEMFPETDPIADNHSGLGYVVLGEADAVEGANSITISRVDSYNILIKTIYVIFEA